MKTKPIFIIILLSSIILTAACGNILESSIEEITPHEATPFVSPPAEQILISDLDELRDFLLGLIMSHESESAIRYLGIDHENIQSKIQAITQEVLRDNLIAAYAVSEISATARRIVVYSEVDIEIIYKKTAEQVSSIIEVPTPLSMVNRLYEAVSGYREEAVFLTDMHLGKDEIASQVAEIYYQNPGRIVMMPYVTVEILPQQLETQGETGGAGDSGQQESNTAADSAPADTGRIYEIKFGYLESTEMLREVGDNLSLSVRQNAARADGGSNGERLLSLVNNLIASTQYDEGIASTIAMHGPQNFAATAYGALVRGSAAGEGFAMAFKALCDELRLDCRVVLGFMGDTVHAWNIVLLEGNYYHIDTAMCAVNGLEAGFLKADTDIAGLYTWDTGTAPRCDGPLTLFDFMPPDDPPDPDDPDNPGDLDARDNNDD